MKYGSCTAISGQKLNSHSKDKEDGERKEEGSKEVSWAGIIALHSQLPDRLKQEKCELKACLDNLVRVK